MGYTSTDCKKIVDELEERNPELIESTFERIKKIVPHYDYFYTLTPVLRTYCSRRGLKFTDENEHELRGRNLSQGLKQEKSTFIAVALWLFSPSIYKIGKRSVKVRDQFRKEMVPIYNAEDNIRHHLAGILGCNESRISQLVNPIACAYHERNTAFKELVDSIVNDIKEQVREEKVEDEPIEEIQQTKCFQ
jgi:hypothetical protein